MNKIITLACTLALSVNAACASSNIKFKWPVPVSVAVDENVLKKGKEAKIHYDIVVENDAKKNQINLQYHNFKILELDGIDLSKEENQKTNQKVIDMMTAVESAMPTLVIDADGKAQDVIGLDETINKTLELLPMKNAEDLESLKTFLKSPVMEKQIKQKSLEVWRLWVETWLSCAPAEGKEDILEVEIPVGATTLISAIQVKNLGPVKEYPDCVKLVADGNFEGEEARKNFAEMMKQLADRIPKKEGVKPFTVDMVQEVSRKTHMEVVINPKTAQTQTALVESSTHMKINDKTKDAIERHEYKFAWPKK
ncbi:MAG: hypothetical protein SFY67_16590 [Candidatus Melainabacteria bacterium]|nr:hypothetical protein [Candidatus Melainabacteria bacterium]